MRALFVAGLFAALAPAQEPPREGIFGEVRTADAKPWVGATVTLLHVAHPALTDARFVDRVTATTDERGRFRAQLLAGMGYAAWASGPVVEGDYRCTPVARDLASGVPVLLREGDVHRHRQVRLQLDASWQGQLRLVATSRIGSFTVREVIPLVDGLATLPPWPETPITVQVELDGPPIFRGGVATTFAALLATRRRMAAEGGFAEPTEAAVRQALSAPHPLAVGPRTEDAIRLVDAGQQPLRGARVVVEGREPQQLLGISDADGVVRFARAAGGKPPYRALAFADACAETVIDEDDWVATTEGAPKTKQLEAGATVHGRLFERDGVAAAAQPLLLEGSIATGQNSTFFGVDARLLTSADDGAIEVPGRIRSHAWYLTAVLTPQQRASLAGPTKAPVAAVALLVPPSDAEPADLGQLRLDRLRQIDVRVVGSDGGEPGPVPVVVIPNPLAQLRNAPHEPLAARTDRHGRLRLLTNEGVTCAVWAMGKTGAAWAIIQAGQPEHTLRLDAAHVLTLQMVDPERKPIAGILAHVVTPEGTPIGDGAAALMPRVHDAFMVHGFPWKQGYTDGQGIVQLVMPFVGVGIDVAFSLGSERMRHTIRGDEFGPGNPTVVEFVANGR